jgi:hypothetical protein
MADIITAPEAGGGPFIRVFNGQTAVQLQQVLAYSVYFLGGVQLAAN